MHIHSRIDAAFITSIECYRQRLMAALSIAVISTTAVDSVGENGPLSYEFLTYLSQEIYMAITRQLDRFFLLWRS